MPWVNIWIHLVFSTKNRELLLEDDIRKDVFTHMKKNGEEKGIRIDHVGGYMDHAHCLISLGSEQSISNVAKMIKVESSFWLNHSLGKEINFQWQKDYWAVSVSEEHLYKLREYIRNQEYHHKKVSFASEIEDFINKYGGEKINDVMPGCLGFKPQAKDKSSF